MKNLLSIVCIVLFFGTVVLAQGTVDTDPTQKTGGIDITSALIGAVVGLVIGYLVGGRMAKK